MLESNNFRPLKLFLLERRLLFILIAFLILSLCYALIIKSYGFGDPVILIESLVALFCFSVFTAILYRIHHYYHSKSAINFVHLSTLVLFSLVYVLVQYKIAHHFFNSTAYHRYTDDSILFRALFCFLILLACVNQFWIDKHLILLTKRNAAYLENETRLARLELMHVKQQIQPHFLFNSLNSINALIANKPKEARSMVILLSDYLRLSIQKKENDFSSLAEEIQFLDLYLEIEKIRFGDRLQIIKEFPKDLNSYTIPSQLLQPILENAIKYGVYGQTGALEIRFKILISTNHLTLEVSNPYDQLIVSSSKGTGFGLQAVRQKLRLLYGRDDLITVDKESELFTIKINFPIN